MWFNIITKFFPRLEGLLGRAFIRATPQAAAGSNEDSDDKPERNIPRATANHVDPYLRTNKCDYDIYQRIERSGLFRGSRFFWHDLSTFRTGVTFGMNGIYNVAPLHRCFSHCAFAPYIHVFPSPPALNSVEVSNTPTQAIQHNLVGTKSLKTKDGLSNNIKNHKPASSIKFPKDYSATFHDNIQLSDREILKDVKEIQHRFFEARFKFFQNQALVHVQKREFSQAVRNWLSSVQYFCHGPTFFNLGIAFERGKGVEPNLEKAVQYYKIAAQEGHAAAKYNLAVIYLKGAAITTESASLNGIFLLLQSSAEHNCLQAQRFLMSERGKTLKFLVHAQSRRKEQFRFLIEKNSDFSTGNLANRTGLSDKTAHVNIDKIIPRVRVTKSEPCLSQSMNVSTLQRVICSR